MRKPFVAFGLAAGLYLALTFALTWPLPLQMGSRVPNDLGDSLLNMFLLAWNAREPPLTSDWWNLPQFFPVPGVMAFSEHLLGLAVITTPAIAATGNALLAYNLAFLLSFPLSAFAAHLLAFELTRRHSLAIVAGLAYGFAPYRMSQLAHVQVLSAYWIPLALLGLHRFLRTRRFRWAALFAASWLMQALACGYYLFYLSVLIALWLLWFAAGRIRWAALGQIAAAWGVAAIVLVPVAFGYLRYQRAYGLRRWPDEIENFSADIASLLKAPANLRLWGWLNVVQRPESDLFPGMAIVLIIAAGVLLAWIAARGADAAPRRAWRLLLGAAALAGFVAATPVWWGPWRLEIAGVRLLSVGSFEKPLSLALLIGSAALALHPAARVAWRRRSPLAFYTIAAVVMWLFSLGPAPTLMNQRLLYKAPYAWLLVVPGVDGVRVPARFWVLATMCLSVAAALALARVAARWRGLRGALPAAAVCALLVESWPLPLTLERPPDPRPSHTRTTARLDLPMASGHDLQALYRAIEHQRPLVNGYSGYFAPHYRALEHLLQTRDSAVLTHLRTLGSLEVVVDHALDPDGRWRAYVAGQPHAEVVHTEASYTSYRLGRLSPVPAPAPLPGEPLPIAAIEASKHQHLVSHMVDANIVTRWDTGGPQDPSDEIVVDLGAVRRLEGLELQLAGFVADFPRLLAIETSEDGAAWRPRWNGPTALMTVTAALASPLTIPLRFPLDDAPARYVRLRQTSRDGIYFWSIAELRLFGS